MKKSNCRSVIQAEFNDLLDTGYYAIHHIFQGVNRRKCEEYGFLIAVRPAEHDLAHQAANKGLQLDYKKQCQRYFEKHYGSREDFIGIFGRSYI